MAIFMRDYENLLQKATKDEDSSEEVKHDRRVLLGDMNDIYYENNDLRLLLDLLAATTGLAQPIRYGKINNQKIFYFYILGLLHS